MHGSGQLGICFTFACSSSGGPMRATTSDSCIPSDTERQRVPKPAASDCLDAAPSSAQREARSWPCRKARRASTQLPWRARWAPQAVKRPSNRARPTCDQNTITCSKRFPACVGTPDIGRQRLAIDRDLERLLADRRAGVLRDNLQDSWSGPSRHHDDSWCLLRSGMLLSVRLKDDRPRLLLPPRVDAPVGNGHGVARHNKAKGCALEQVIRMPLRLRNVRRPGARERALHRWGRRRSLRRGRRSAARNLARSSQHGKNG